MDVLALYNDILCLLCMRPNLTRRELATYIFVKRELLNEEQIDVYDIYPDGVESTTINVLVDALVNNGILVSYFGKLVNTIDCNNLLSGNTRIFNKLLSIPYRTLIDVAGYFLLRRRSPDYWLEQKHKFINTEALISKLKNEIKVDY